MEHRDGAPHGGSGCDERGKPLQTGKHVVGHCSGLPECCQGAGPARTGPHRLETLKTVCATLAAVDLKPHWHRGRYTITGIPAGHTGSGEKISMAPLNVIVKTAAQLRLSLAQHLNHIVMQIDLS